MPERFSSGDFCLLPNSSATELWETLSEMEMLPPETKEKDGRSYYVFVKPTQLECRKLWQVLRNRVREADWAYIYSRLCNDLPARIEIEFPDRESQSGEIRFYYPKHDVYA